MKSGCPERREKRKLEISGAQGEPPTLYGELLSVQRNARDVLGCQIWDHQWYSRQTPLPRSCHVKRHHYAFSTNHPYGHRSKALEFRRT